MTRPDPYHEGERRVQARAGEQWRSDAVGRNIVGQVPPQIAPFLAEQRLLALGSVDDRGLPCASVVFGSPGMVASPDPSRLVLEMALAHVERHDPLWRNARARAPLGALVIDLAARRRLRINGRLERPVRAGDTQLVLAVDAYYGNCTRYIQRREPVGAGAEAGMADAGADAAPVPADALSPAQVALIERTDTLFVATAHPQAGADVSHRGGRPGFVRVRDRRRLAVPDYAGNAMYNTLGNIETTGVAAIVMLDFAGRQLLQVSGRAAIDWDARAPEIERHWTLDIDTVRALPMPAHAALGAPAPWPDLPLVGP